MLKNPVIEIKKLNHYFGSKKLRKQVLFDINLEIESGDILIMTGPSGSGKSTLMSLIGGLRSVQEGNLKVLKQELKNANEQHLVRIRRQIGYIFQRNNLVQFLTVQQNVQMSLKLQPNICKKHISTRARAMLDSVGLGHRINYYPQNLSGGERQRTAIACALVTHPKLILADEPTASLDRDAGHNIMKLLQRLAKEQETTILIATHDYRILPIADRIISIEDGKVQEPIPLI
ncbi:ATP-binding cassette domain-containing protein [Nostoc sp. MS1]|uniref:ATP-binding cassette domain-containing protein n=1 Tax=Nostoc sp. MS1 TaxID=2764711 RepID=UPI001CC5B312|nr:ATP-binding cassette domain-containing protein [Nostoc sp. MS1]BCL39005.1 ABC transporter [Nostoc sp. MS1]